MKKMFLVVIMMQFALPSFAQDPRITLGNIPNNYESVNGKEPATKTTRSQMIANDKFVANMPGNEVRSYSFMLKSGIDIIYGPVNVKGAQLTPDIISEIKKSKGTCIYAYFDEIKVKTPDGLIHTYSPMVFTFDH